MLRSAFRTSGDSAILAHHSLRVKSIIYPQSSNLNDVLAVSIEIYNNGFEHVVLCVSNPPALITNNLKTITDLIDQLCSKYHFVIFVDDFNFPFLTENVNIASYNKCSTLVEKIIEFGLRLLVNEPTRGHSILDMLFCTEFVSYEDVLVSPPFASSDHCSLEISINILSNENINLGDKCFNYSKCDFDQLNNFCIVSIEIVC